MLRSALDGLHDDADGKRGREQHLMYLGCRLPASADRPLLVRSVEDFYVEG